MKHARAQAYIRQLCCLGLGKEVLIPELLRAIHTVIPSESNVFTGVNGNMVPTYVIPEYVLPEVVEPLKSERDRIFTSQFLARLVQWYSRHRIMPDPTIPDERFYQSDLYHLVFRPYNHYHRLQAMLRNHGVPTGGVSLCRSQNQRPFSLDDQQLLERLLPYVEYGLQAHGVEAGAEYVDSGQGGMIILTRGGTVAHLSDSARTLLFLATYGAFPVGQARFSQEVTIPPALRRICENLDGIFQNRDTPPPAFSHTNASGRFVFRAYWLQPPTVAPGLDTIHSDLAGNALIGVMIEHQEPLRLKLLRNLQRWHLSAREQDVCLALADGLSHPAIAVRLHVSPQTVVTYIRRIHEKVGVHSREELLKTLLNPGPSTVKGI